jgi:hypothetical protein
MHSKPKPELQQAAQRIRAIGDRCMDDDFPMFRRRLTFPLSLLAGALVVASQMLDYLEPMKFDAAKIALWIAGLIVFGVTLTLRLWPRTWKR